MRSVVEIAFGLLFLIGAVFNTLYTMRHGAEFYGSFADGALWPVARTLVRTIVIPRARFFTALMIVFQLVVAVCILSRGPLVAAGLAAGAIFALGAVLVSNAAGAIANLAMGILLAYLGLTR
ncbi:MAG TPA: hypothetical protein VLL49_02525 [Anaerolineales bacterium]|nr:hypothetical protein [Anaerolineales bacterium]